MLSERWRKLEDAFDAALAVPESERKAFLDQVCNGDDEFRKELECMLNGSMDGVFTAAIASAAATISDDAQDAGPQPGSALGPYRILALLGRGGMGAVYRAVREDQFHKEVAIKVIPKILAGPEAISRFRAERQILAGLEHPHIARLLDGGTADGVPYLVMEFVEGVPVTLYAQQRHLALRDRLRLFQSICSAVQYAHGKLIVHRDLKPANILVTAQGVAKLLDFGVAKLLDPSVESPEHTASMMMTPDYASPEQVRGEPVTTAGDVYSLGVVLYELLTGERPYKITGSSPAEIERSMRDTGTRRLSNLPGLSLRQRRQFAGDLDNIVLMAMHQDIDRRYKSAEQFSRDIEMYLSGMPVQARPDTFVYRSAKFAARNRWAVVAACAVFLSMTAAAVVSLREARATQRRFDQLRGFARKVLVDLHGQLTDIPGTGRARQALIDNVNDYLKQLMSGNAEDDTALAAELATTYLRLGEMQGTTHDAIASFESAIGLMERKANRTRADTNDVVTMARIRVRLGTTQLDLGKLDEGGANLTEGARLAVGIPLKQLPHGPEAAKLSARAHLRLGRVYRGQYRLAEAENHAGLSIALCEQLAQMQKGNADREVDEIQTGARMVRAGVLRRLGRWEESFALYQVVLADNRQRIAQNPTSFGNQRDLARTHTIISDMLSLVPGREGDARFHVREAIRVAENLAAADPSDFAAQSELGQALSTASELLIRPQDRPEAIHASTRAARIYDALLHKEPDNSLYLLYGGVSYCNLGELQSRPIPTAESIANIRKGVELIQKLVDRDPRDKTSRIQLMRSESQLAQSLARAGAIREAMIIADESIRKAKELDDGVGGPLSALPRRELPRANALKGYVYRSAGKLEESRKAYQLALQQWDAWRSDFKLPDADKEIDEVRAAAQGGKR